MNDELNEKIKIKGGSRKVNKYIEKLIEFFRAEKGNLFAFLLTLSEDELDNLSINTDEQSAEWKEVSIALSVMAYSIEQSQYNEKFSVKTDTLIDSSRCFCVMCGLALQDKLGLIKIKDDSFFWEYDGKIEITPLEPMKEILKKML